MHGSPLDISINGISFVSTADCDISFTNDEWDNDLEPNGSGPASISSVRKVPAAESITLRVNSTEVDMLRTWSNAAEFVDFHVVLRDGSVRSCKGLLILDQESTAKGTQTIKIKCRTGWDILAA